MTVRELPRAEWARLEGCDLGPLVAGNPACVVAVIVVEDRDGTIVGHWALVALLHAEGVWIDPAHRQGGAVARKLLGKMVQTIRACGAGAVVTGAATPEVAALLERKLGAMKLEYTPYYWPMNPVTHALVQGDLCPH